MPKIESHIIIKKPREEVFKLLKDMECFPEFMPDIKSLKILEQKDNKLITQWQIEIERTAIKWKEEDIFDDKTFTLKFRVLEGDYEEYEGTWKLESHLGTTRVRIEAFLDWGIPVLEMFVGNVLEKKTQLAFQDMLKSLKKKIEGK